MLGLYADINEKVRTVKIHDTQFAISEKYSRYSDNKSIFLVFRTLETSPHTRTKLIINSHVNWLYIRILVQV